MPPSLIPLTADAPERSEKPKKPKKPSLTHFLALPLHHAPNLQATLDAFAVEIADLDISPKAFRPAVCSHLTLGVMSLQDPEQIAKATELLARLDLKSILQGAAQSPKTPSEVVKGVGTPGESSQGHENPSGEVAEALDASERRLERSESPDGGVKLFEPDEPTTQETLDQPAITTEPSAEHPDAPLQISLRGVSTMGNPKSTTLLYLSPFDPTNRLLAFAKRTKEVFEEAGVMEKDERKFKLHATIINTIYADSRGKRRRRDKKKRGKRKEKEEAVVVAAAAAEEDNGKGAERVEKAEESQRSSRRRRRSRKRKKSNHDKTGNVDMEGTDNTYGNEDLKDEGGKVEECEEDKESQASQEHAEDTKDEGVKEDAETEVYVEAGVEAGAEAEVEAEVEEGDGAEDKAEESKANKEGKGNHTLKFDARELIKKHVDRVFCEEFKLEEVAIFKMGAKDLDGVKGAGGYELVASKRIFDD